MKGTPRICIFANNIQPPSSLFFMRNRLQDATEIAIKRTIWNFTTAIPMYYPKFDKMSLLLPLSLVHDDVVDIVLVVEKMKSGAYRGRVAPYPLLSDSCTVGYISVRVYNTRTTGGIPISPILLKCFYSASIPSSPKVDPD